MDGGRSEGIEKHDSSHEMKQEPVPPIYLPNMDAGGPIHDGENAADETCFAEVARFRVSPREKIFGIQVPLGVWHSIEVHEPSTIFEAKDGKYGK